MAGLEVGSFVLGALLYTAALVAFFLPLIRPGARVPRLVGPSLLGAGGAMHFVFILLASLVAKVCPVESLHFALSVAVLVTVAAYLGARVFWSIDALGVLVAPVGLTFLLGTRFAGLSQTAPKLSPAFLTLHVAANVIGDALFLLACGAAGLYLVVERGLRKKRPALMRLPPLDVLDRAEHRFLLMGFPLLTLGIVTGTQWAAKLETGSLSEMVRTLLGYTTWAVFAGVLVLRAVLGWRGRRAAYGTIAGFTVAASLVVFYLARPQ